MATTKTDNLDNVKNILLEEAKPLITGECVQWEEDDIFNLTVTIKAVHEMATKLREAHDRMIVAWEEGNNVEPGTNAKVQTIRQRKGTSVKTEGFLKGF